MAVGGIFSRNEDRFVKATGAIGAKVSNLTSFKQQLSAEALSFCNSHCILYVATGDLIPSKNFKN